MTFQPRNIQPRAAFTDYTPAGPWTDGQIVVRNIDGVGFTYSVSLNALSVIPNQSYATKDANNYAIINLPTPANPGDAASKSYVDAGAGTGGIPEAPTDGQIYGRQNSAWTEIPPSGGGSTGEWRFNNNTAPPPPSGDILFNNATQSSATVVYIHATTNNGVDATHGLKILLVTGSRILVQDEGNSSNYIVFEATANATYTSPYYGVPVSLVENGGAIANNRLVLIGINPPAPGINDAPSDGTLYGRENAEWVNAVPLAGGTMTGPLILNGDPTTNLGASTKQYVDNSHVPPSTTTPLMDGTAAVGTGTTYARADHIHPSDTSRAPLASPALTGTPTAPTATAGTNSAQIATTAFVDTAISGAAGITEAPSDGFAYARANAAWARKKGLQSHVIYANVGSGTYTTPAGCIAIEVWCIGGGGGGGGSSTGTSGGVGTTGGNTTFGTLTANGGAGIGNASQGGSGGGASGGDVNVQGGAGQGSSPTANMIGGQGGTSRGGGNGGGGAAGNPGLPAPPGTGGGGGGGGGASTGWSAAGGGGGGYTFKLFVPPAATYSYNVGGGGNGGAAGTGGYAGGAGGSGLIIVEEFY